MLRVSELYTSVQGEGARTGLLTQFIRFAGCNMRCPGWPCDTVFAIDPNIWRFDSEKVSNPIELARRIESEAHKASARNICLTGGEPFLQPNNELFEMINCLAHPSKAFTFEAFTNGSFALPEWTKDPLIDMHFTMDWKLIGSGEQDTALDVRKANALWLQKTDSIKFVVGTVRDVNEAVDTAELLRDDGCKAQFWMGRVWNGEINDEDIVNAMMGLGLSDWHLNIQTHKHIWDPDERGV